MVIDKRSHSGPVDPVLTAHFDHRHMHERLNIAIGVQNH
jgi:hypothetical protein